MHIHLPKPLHGWREFLGEVGIVVVGVLIALGAEQIIENIRWQEKVAQAKEQLAEELHDDEVSAYKWLSTDRCLEDQLDGATAAVDRARETGVISPVPAYQPPLVEFSSDAWLNARSLQVADHMGPAEMRTYSRIYFFPTELQGDIVQLHEFAAELGPITGGLHHVSPQEAGEYQRTLGQIRELQNRTQLAEALLLKRASAAGISLSSQEMNAAVQYAKSNVGNCASAPNVDHFTEARIPRQT